MSEQSKPEPPERRDLGGELVIPGLAFGFTLYYFYSIHDAPWTAKVSTYLIGTVLLILVTTFAISSLRRILRKQASLGLGTLGAPGWLLPKRLALLGLTVAYIVVLQWGGFTLTTAVFLYLTILLLGGIGAHRRAFVLAIIVPLVGYVLFIAIFKTRFPEGPFEQLMKGFF